MADKYLGKYDRVSADKYDEFLKELGVNMLLRKAATASSPVFEVRLKRVIWRSAFIIILSFRWLMIPTRRRGASKPRQCSKVWSWSSSWMKNSTRNLPTVAMSRPKLPRKAIASSLFKTPSKKAKSPLKSFVSSRLMRLFKPLLSLVAISSVPKKSTRDPERRSRLTFYRLGEVGEERYIKTILLLSSLLLI